MPFLFNFLISCLFVNYRLSFVSIHFISFSSNIKYSLFSYIICLFFIEFFLCFLFLFPLYSFFHICSVLFLIFSTLLTYIFQVNYESGMASIGEIIQGIQLTINPDIYSLHATVQCSRPLYSSKHFVNIFSLGCHHLFELP